MYSNISLAILSGGQNSRFHGFNKSFIKIQEKRIIDFQLEAFNKLFAEIIIVSNTPDLFAEFQNVKLVSDRFSEIGPLAGIDAALNCSVNDQVFVIGCDMPFFNNNVMDKIIDKYFQSDYSIVITSIDQRIQPLFGVYSKRISKDIESLIQSSEKKSVMRLVDSQKSKIIPLSKEELEALDFYNINSPFDLKILRDKL